MTIFDKICFIYTIIALDGFWFGSLVPTEHVIVHSDIFTIRVSQNNDGYRRTQTLPADWSKGCNFQCLDDDNGKLTCPEKVLLYLEPIEVFKKDVETIVRHTPADRRRKEPQPAPKCLKHVHVSIKSIGFVLQDIPEATVDVKIPNDFTIDTVRFLVQGGFGVSLTAGINSDIIAQHDVQVRASDKVEIHVDKIQADQLRIVRSETRRQKSLFGHKTILKQCPLTRIRANHALIVSHVDMVGFDPLVTGFDGMWACKYGVIYHFNGQEPMGGQCNSQIGQNHQGVVGDGHPRPGQQPPDI